MAKHINLKKILLFIRYLQEEEAECRKICYKAKDEFENSVRNAHYDFNVFDESLDSDFTHDTAKSSVKQSPEDSRELIDEPNKTRKSISHPKWAKYLFRKIVMLTHPDKINERVAEDIKLKFLSMYQDAKKSLDSLNYVRLVIIADDLRIDISQAKIQDSKIFQEKEKGLTSQISSLKSSLYWQWAHSSDDEKEKILQEFIKLRGWTSRDSQRKKSRKGPGKHPGKSLSQIKKSKILKKQ